MKGMNGFEVCRRIKACEEFRQIPVIFISAATEVEERVEGLALGAVDFVSKPFRREELLARVRAAVRRTGESKEVNVFAFGDVSVDFAKMEIVRGGQPVSMTPHEFSLLKFFVQNAGRVIPRSELLREVWGYQDYPATRTVDNHIWKLRVKLESKPAEPVHFLTVHGAGYKFLA